MSRFPEIRFVRPYTPKRGTVVIFVSKGGFLSSLGKTLDQATSGFLGSIIKTSNFDGTLNEHIPVFLNNSGITSVILFGIGSEDDLDNELSWKNLGAQVFKTVSKVRTSLLIALETAQTSSINSSFGTAFALGFRLASYNFNHFKTKKETDNNYLDKVSISITSTTKTIRENQASIAVTEGVFLARDLVNYPANQLGPQEFAEKALELSSLGCDVKVFTEPMLRTQNMRAMLAVGQGSARPPCLVTIERRPSNVGKRSKPLAIIGKGVVFDSGGISIKPAANMEDMKGDMGGAAAVLGTMLALSKRNSRAHVVGVLALAENMPDGNAYRPGDIITSMSGQTIEVVNTDAEGRLVLADALTYTNQAFQPSAMINLATLTGAILIALGQEQAGLFSNSDNLADKLHQAGLDSGDLLWRLPMSKAYDKMINSRFADMKNSGGRMGGSITAAHFLKRFVDNTPWAHLDIAGTAMAAPKTALNPSWGSGYGVQILNRFIANNYE